VRVIVNRLVAAGRPTGIGHYTTQLVRHLRALDNIKMTEFPPEWIMRAGSMARHARGLFARTTRPSSSMQRSSFVRPSWRTQLIDLLRDGGSRLLGRAFAAACQLQRPDVYHEPNYIPLPCDHPTVVTIHDLSVLLHPEWHPADRVAAFERRFREGLGRTTHILAVSDAGRQEIVSTLHVPPERVTRVYNGVRDVFRPLPEAEVRTTLARLGLPPRYFLHIGTLEPRKNLLFLMRVYCSLPAPVRERYPLVLVGGWGWNASEIADFFEREGRHRGVVRPGYIGDRHLPAVYNGARALLFPSLYEGFGLPPVEMLACGGAVLASTDPAVVETAGTRAHLLDPTDPDAWRTAMSRVAEDDDWWLQLRHGAVDAVQHFTWASCADETLAVYRRVAGHAGEQRRAS
jgi:alpha-1,3-rhamnosyl/mannosyltransferase